MDVFSIYILAQGLWPFLSVTVTTEYKYFIWFIINRLYWNFCYTG